MSRFEPNLRIRGRTALPVEPGAAVAAAQRALVEARAGVAVPA